jgi:predicted pyridoxine 5'-phosphate oxidase superfamily flavin-nucleotide-binding protein
MSDFYKSASRGLQDHFNSRQLADRLEEMIVHEEITEQDREFIATRDMMFISTVDAYGSPTLSYKGGDVGFIRVVDSKTLAFPGYDGNGMFLTAGNIAASSKVGMLLIDFENPMRLRLHGSATVDPSDPLLSDFTDALYIIRVAVDNLFINCPRYIHRYQKLAKSEYVPQAGCPTPVPEWKSIEALKEVLPENL